MDVLTTMNLKNGVERVLHVKGNYQGGILEMTLVVDCSLPKEYADTMSREIAGILRLHSEIFRNVRLNLLWWKSEKRIENQPAAMPFLQMGTYFETYQEIEGIKYLDGLAEVLKLYHARSKLILILADDPVRVRDSEKIRQTMHPFLGKKSLFLIYGDEEKKWRRGEEITEYGK